MKKFIPAVSLFLSFWPMACWKVIDLTKETLRDPDAGDAEDLFDDGRGDTPDDASGEDTPDDDAHECDIDEDCDDGNLCNGRETCSRVTWSCVSGPSLEEGSVCRGDPRMVCIAGGCAASTCGDGFVDTGAGEFCDPPVEGECDSACRRFCTQETDCLDDGNYCNGEEICDGGTQRCSRRNPRPDGDVCQVVTRKICISGTCQPSICGDGFPDGESAIPEECDDANSVNGDGCDNDCGYSCHNDGECDDGHDCTQDMCDTELQHRCLNEPSSATQVCREAAGPCDVTEQCDGVGRDCPPNLFAGGSTACRSMRGSCDSPEYCTGTSIDCPEDEFVLPGTDCNDGNPNTLSDRCDERGLCRGVPPGSLLFEALMVSAGDNHNCAVSAAGEIRCWGNNSYGQLGNGTMTHSPFPEAVTGLASAPMAVSAGYFHTCAVLEGGSVQCWGDNTYGRLGDGTENNSSTPVTVMTLVSGVRMVSTGFHHSCALLETGGLKCWGRNNYGQLGDGTTQDRSIPVDVQDFSSGAGAVVAAGFHSCALLVTGGVKCWGRNNVGQLGDGTTTDSAAPLIVNGLSSGAEGISAFYEHTCARMTGGNVVCWGGNSYGQLGDGTTTRRTVPVGVSGLSSGVQGVSAGYQHTCALLSTGAIRCWGRNETGRLGDSTTADRWEPTDVYGLSSEAAAVSAGGYHTCALLASGDVQCWGKNWNGQLGDGMLGYTTAPVSVAGLSPDEVSSLALGDDHSCAVTADGDVVCWGRNGSGRLGDGTVVDSFWPLGVAGLEERAGSVTAGRSHTCTLLGPGGAACWGSNIYGQLGDATTTTSMVPVSVLGLSSGAAALSCGGNHTCAILTSGPLECWGSNASGQLGDGSTTNRNIPTAVPGLSSLQAVASGGEHTCALDALDAAWCWGSNSDGQLGDGSGAGSNIPVTVAGLPPSTEGLAAGASHTCAIVSTGGLMCWGDNEFGQLGDGTAADSMLPAEVTGLAAGVEAVTAGSHHTCAILDSGSVQCWGADTYGQLGNGLTEDSPSPVTVSGLLPPVTAMAAGASHTCAVDAEAVKCWGQNYYGQVGSGILSFATAPVSVILEP